MSEKWLMLGHEHVPCRNCDCGQSVDLGDGSGEHCGQPRAAHYVRDEKPLPTFADVRGILKDEPPATAGSAHPIPVSAAAEIAARFGYDQVIVLARKVGESGMEHVTTYGSDAEHCAVAARIGEFLKFKIMGWARDGE